jgi:hypothetical protein
MNGLRIGALAGSVFVAALAAASAARADMAVCLSSGGDWKATGSVSKAMSVMGAWGLDFADEVKAERLVPATPMNPEVPGDCMVKSAGGLGKLPDGCKEGSTATVTGRLSFDAGIAIVNVASSDDITCN